MITTITVANTTTTAAATTLALITILALLTMLIQKEIVGDLKGERARSLSRALNITIVPLIVVFVITVAFRIVDILY
jgi:hypothetical protein